VEIVTWNFVIGPNNVTESTLWGQTAPKIFEWQFNKFLQKKLRRNQHLVMSSLTLYRVPLESWQQNCLKVTAEEQTLISLYWREKHKNKLKTCERFDSWCNYLHQGSKRITICVFVYSLMDIVAV